MPNPYEKAYQSACLENALDAIDKASNGRLDLDQSFELFDQHGQTFHTVDSFSFEQILRAGWIHCAEIKIGVIVDCQLSELGAMHLRSVRGVA